MEKKRTVISFKQGIARLQKLALNYSPDPVHVNYRREADQYSSGNYRESTTCYIGTIHTKNTGTNGIGATYEEAYCKLKEKLDSFFAASETTPMVPTQGLDSGGEGSFE